MDFFQPKRAVVDQLVNQRCHLNHVNERIRNLSNFCFNKKSSINKNRLPKKVVRSNVFR